MFENLKIPSQIRAGEHLLMLLHRHWIVFVFKIGYLLMLIVTTFIVLTMNVTLITIFGTAIFWG